MISLSHKQQYIPLLFPLNKNIEIWNVFVLSGDREEKHTYFSCFNFSLLRWTFHHFSSIISLFHLFSICSHVFNEKSVGESKINGHMSRERGMRYEEKKKNGYCQLASDMSKAQDLTVSGKEEFYWTNLWIECQLMPFLNACQQRERKKEKWMRNSREVDEVMRFYGIVKLKMCGRAREREDEGKTDG